MRGIGYARVSSHEQIEGTSLKSQEEQIKAYTTMKGIDLVGLHIDRGVSGGKPLADRPAGREMVHLLEIGEADIVIVAKLDRGFRSASECLVNVEAWEKKEIALHILNLGGQTIDTSTPTGKFFITVMAAAAELERNLINERCNDGRKARKAEGKRIGEVPFGWSLNTDGKTLVENSEEQRVLNIIRELREQGLSLRTIAEYLNSEGHKAKKGGQWTHGQIQSILRRAA